MNNAINDINQLLRNRYRLQERLGKGGVALTYRAIDTLTGQACAVKCLSFHHLSEWKTYELFEREAAILKKLHHPNIPRYLDFFTEETPEEIRFYLVQEFIEGNSLASRIAEGTHFTEREALKLAEQLCEILAYLHSFSPPIIHRDMKPGNIIITQDQRVFLIDFGAVREKILADYSTFGGGSTIAGTFGYMPFEQFQGRALPASDIYALGMTLIHALSLKNPAEMAQKGGLLDFRPHLKVSSGFASVLQKMIAPTLAQRYQDVQHLRKDLNTLLAGKRILRPRAVVSLAAALTFTALIAFNWKEIRSLRHPPSPPIETPLPAVDPALKIEALLEKSRAHFFAGGEELEAIIAGIKAGKLATAHPISETLKDRVTFGLREIIDGAHEYFRLPGHHGAVSVVAFSPDDRLLASVGMVDALVKIWNLSDGAMLHAFSPERNSVNCLAFSPDSAMLATGGNALKLWDVRTGQESVALIQESELAGIGALAFSSDGAILAAGAAFSPPPSQLSREQLIASRGAMPTPQPPEEKIVLWDVASGSRFAELQYELKHVTSLLFNADHSLLAAVGTTASNNGTAGYARIELWNVNRKMPFPGNSTSIFASEYSQRQTPNLLRIGFASDGSFLIAEIDTGAVNRWNSRQRGALEKLEQKMRKPRVFFESDEWPDVVNNASGSTQIVYRFDRQRIFTMRTPIGFDFSAYAFSSDKLTLAAASRHSNIINLWRLRSPEEFNTFYKQSENGREVWQSPDGRYRAERANAITTLWESNGAERRIGSYRSGWPLERGDSSADGQWVAAYDDNADGTESILKLRHQSNSQPAEELLHTDGFARCRFSPDSSMLAATDSNMTIHLWQVAEEKRKLASFSYPLNAVHFLGFSDDSTRLFAESRLSHSIKIIDLDLERLLTKSCEWIGDYLKYGAEVSEENRAICDNIAEHRRLTP